MRMRNECLLVSEIGKNCILQCCDNNQYVIKCTYQRVLTTPRDIRRCALPKVPSSAVEIAERRWGGPEGLHNHTPVKVFPATSEHLPQMDALPVKVCKSNSSDLPSEMEYVPTAQDQHQK